MPDPEIAGEETPESEEEQRKKERERLWKRILTYYMIEKYLHEPEKAEDILRTSLGLPTIAELSAQAEPVSLLECLTERAGGEESVSDLLCALEQGGGMDDLFQELLHELRKDPPSKEALSRALMEVVDRAPERVLKEAVGEKEKKAERQRQHQEKMKAAGIDDDFEVIDTEDVKYEEKLEKQTKLLRKVMPADRFACLSEGLSREGYSIGPNGIGPKGKSVRMPDCVLKAREKADGKGREKTDGSGREKADGGGVFRAAARKIAEWEQRDAPVFDEKKAEARAKELYASRSFQAYRKGRPENLRAAARGQGVETVCNDIAALDADLKRRDAVLVNTRDAMKKMATGKTRGFYQVLKALDDYVNAGAEPTQKHTNNLKKSLAEFVTADCAPTNREADRASFTEAMTAMKALLPEKEFGGLLRKVNEGRVPKVKAEDFDRNPGQREKQEPENLKKQEPERILKLTKNPL